jgi:hypothetical protein
MGYREISEDIKQQIKEFCKTHRQVDAVRKFGVSKYFVSTLVRERSSFKHDNRCPITGFSLNKSNGPSN